MLNRDKSACGESLPTRAEDPASHHRQGVHLHTRGDLVGASRCYGRALEIEPQYIDSHFNLGTIFEASGRLDEAICCYKTVLQFRPDHAEALNNLGSLFQRKGELDKADSFLQRAARLQPNCTRVLYNLGVIGELRGEIEGAIAYYREVIRLQSDCADAHNNICNCLQKKRHYDLAIKHAEAALSIEPDHAWAHFNRAVLWLRRQDFKRGWPEYEWRFKARRNLPALHQPRWNGAPLKGRSVLIYAEQGFGDTLQFVRYLPMVKASGGDVLFACQPQLLKLFDRLAYVDFLLTQSKDWNRKVSCDVQIPLLSLPGLLKTTLSEIPDKVPYIEAPEKDVQKWRCKITTGPCNVGIVWSSGPSDRKRDCDPKILSVLCKIPEVTLYSLQKGPPAKIVKDLPDCSSLVDISNSLRDFGDTAAVIACMDLVISVDTAVAHLAGAMGKRVWTLLPYNSDWRWFLDRNDSPWYPTMQLFRQSQPGDWSAVIERVAEELKISSGRFLAS